MVCSFFGSHLNSRWWTIHRYFYRKRRLKSHKSSDTDGKPTDEGLYFQQVQRRPPPGALQRPKFRKSLILKGSCIATSGALPHRFTGHTPAGAEGTALSGSFGCLPLSWVLAGPSDRLRTRQEELRVKVRRRGVFDSKTAKARE